MTQVSMYQELSELFSVRDNQEYCAMCTVVAVADGDKYCLACANEITEALALKFNEQVAVDGGLY